MVNHRMLKAHVLGKAPTQIADGKLGDELALHRKHHKIAERHVAEWLYVRTLADEPNKGAIFNGEIFDVSRAGLRVRLIENGAVVFVPGSLILANKERLKFNAEAGTVSIDNDVVYRVGGFIEVVLNEVNQETRSIVAKPVEIFV